MKISPALALALALALAAPLQAQDTTQAYPWRLSYFPYLTASPNDGVMAMGRVIFFRQSRWDDRVSLHSSVAIEGGYSTKDSWLARVRGDFPQLGDGWRLQAIAEASRTANFGTEDADPPVGATRQLLAIEGSRRLGGSLLLALRGEAVHVDATEPGFMSIPAVESTERDLRGRIAIVADLRDREYDTRSGALIQGGFFFGSPDGKGERSYGGEYGMASGWLPLGEATRATARVAARFGDHIGTDASRVIPAWEDDLVVTGGPESNRALPIGAIVNDCVYLAAAELRHDLKRFPGGALSALIFVDASRTDNCGRDAVTGVAPADTLPGQTTRIGRFPYRWIIGPGVGLSLRLLRNAILTATVAHAEGATRVYVSSGWSW